MVIQKKRPSKKRVVKASNQARSNRRRIVAEDEIEEEVEETDVEVAPEASDLLFEAEDVAELVAEVTGEEVAVTAEDDVVTFEVGEDEYVVEAEGDEEILESTKLNKAGKKAVKASKKVVRKGRARR